MNKSGLRDVYIKSPNIESISLQNNKLGLESSRTVIGKFEINASDAHGKPIPKKGSGNPGGWNVDTPMDKRWSGAYNSECRNLKTLKLRENDIHFQTETFHGSHYVAYIQFGSDIENTDLILRTKYWYNKDALTNGADHEITYFTMDSNWSKAYRYYHSNQKGENFSTWIASEWTSGANLRNKPYALYCWQEQAKHGHDMNATIYPFGK